MKTTDRYSGLRLFAYLAAVMLACAVLAGLTGCQTQYVRPDGSLVPEPEASLIRVNDGVTAAYSLIADARDAGAITQSDIAQYAAVVQTIDDARHAASDDLRNGDKTGVTKWTDVARVALTKLQPLLTKAKR